MSKLFGKEVKKDQPVENPDPTYFVTEEEYKNAVATIEIAIRQGQLSNKDFTLGIGIKISDNKYMYYDTARYGILPPTPFYHSHLLSSIVFKSEESIREDRRRKHEDDLKRLQEEITRRAKEMEEIGKKLGEL